MVLRNEGRLEEARAALARHLELSAEVGNRLGEAVALANLGLVERDLGRYDDPNIWMRHPVP